MPVTTPICLPLTLEPRPLLDVRLEVGGDRESEWAARQIGGCGEGLNQGGAKPHAGRIGDIEAVLEVEVARKRGRAHGARSEAAALLVVPGDHVERPFGRDAGSVQRLERLEGCEHAEDAIEPAAGGLAVHVRAGDHRCRGAITPGRRMNRFAMSSTAGW